jgi:hypothetical protein
MMAQVTGQSLYVRQSLSGVQGTEVGERERLMDYRDELAAMVKARKLEVGRVIERRCNHGCGSAKEVWQMIGAIWQGQSQIEVIDLQLESSSTS